MPAPSLVAPLDHGRVDIAIAGGGLSGGLIALAVQARYPDLVVALVEAGDTLGGNHRWSWFESDLDLAGRTLLAPFRTTRWNDGYDVRFPAHRRTLPSRYRSLASADFHAGLLRELNQGTVRTGSAIAALDTEGLTLADGTRIAARTVIDCRGITQAPGLTGGWQVFMGRHMRTRTPHGVERPVIMDATVTQEGGYRFVYVLPLGVDELFVEDTYYADSPELDRRTLGARIEAYVRHHGWEGEILGNETGVLPVITGGDFGAFQAAYAVPGVAQAGARGGFVHPLTSYTLPQATRLKLPRRHAEDRRMRLVRTHPVQQGLQRIGRDHDALVGGPHETFACHAGVEGDQIVVEAEGVQQAHGLLVIAKLRPADRFPQFVHRSHSAGKGNETVRKIGKRLFTLVHSGNHVQLSTIGIGYFGAGERFGNNADHLAPGRQRAAGQRAHQAQPAAAIDHADAALRQLGTHRTRKLDIARIGWAGRPAIDGKTAHFTANPPGSVLRWP